MFFLLPLARIALLPANKSFASNIIINTSADMRNIILKNVVKGVDV